MKEVSIIGQVIKIVLIPKSSDLTGFVGIMLVVVR